MILKKIFNRFEYLKMKHRINWIKTIYANFRMLPIKDAIKLPILVYTRTSLLSTSGKVRLNIPAKFGLLQIGLPWFGPLNHPSRTCFFNSGIIELNGSCRLANGSKINIQGGILSLGDKVLICECVRIVCMNSISIGDNSRVAHESQIMDSNFHYLYKVKTCSIQNCIKPVCIGKDNWIGNRCTVAAGTTTPDRMIAAAFSLLNKNYTNLSTGDGLVVGGVPAKALATGVYRVFNPSIENGLRLYFSNSKNITYRFEQEFDIKYLEDENSYYSLSSLL